MTRPLELTTRTHPIAVGVYSGQVALGVTYVLGLSEPRALFTQLGTGFSILWAVGLLFAALAALVGIFSRDVVFGMTSELLGTTIAWALNGIYILALFQTYDYQEIGIILATFIGLWFGFGVRVVQLILESRTLVRARIQATVADPPVLGEPDNRPEV